VTRRSGGWRIRLDVGVDAETGKRRQVSRQGFRTKREAEAVLNDLLLEHEAIRQPDVSVFGPTVVEYLEEWLTRARVSVRESTWAAYRNAVVHLVDGLGGGSLRLLSPVDVQRFEQQLLASGRSAKTVANVHAVLHRALADALRAPPPTRRTIGAPRRCATSSSAAALSSSSTVSRPCGAAARVPFRARPPARSVCRSSGSGCRR
jgi:Arm domain-containing DNA-binding protein/integrase-like protein